MARKDIVVSALHALTNDEFEYSDFSDNNALQALVTEYFAGGNDDTDDDGVSSDEEEICMLKFTKSFHNCLIRRKFDEFSQP